MNVLICVANIIEIEPFLSKHCDINPNQKEYSFQYNKYSITVVITGVGMIQMAVKTTEMLTKNSFDFAINMGICGSYTIDINLGEVFKISEDGFPELCYLDEENCLSHFESGIIKDEEPFVNGRITCDDRINSLLPLSKNWASQKANTVNILNSDNKFIKKYQENSQISLETMEGAAFMYACKVIDIPFIQLRAVSNYVSVRDKKEWQIALSVENLEKVLEFFLSDFDVN